MMCTLHDDDDDDDDEGDEGDEGRWRTCGQGGGSPVAGTHTQLATLACHVSMSRGNTSS